MRNSWVPIWKKAPFIRLLLPIVIGILVQWTYAFDEPVILFAIFSFGLALALFRFLPLSIRFKFQTLQGFILNLILIAFGLLITHQKDIRNRPEWFGNNYHDSDYLVVTVNEPLVEKNKSFKADAIITNVVHNKSVLSTTGKVILYFKKDSLKPPLLQYGDKILIDKPLQKITNSGNPGAFNYQRYSSFKQIFHNIFLKDNEWAVLHDKDVDPFKKFLFTCRQNILAILRKHVGEDDDQLAIAEALLIGYTQDLDKDLVQAYSNTGVVHIIAISGMHLALIYLLLVKIFNKIPFVKRSRIIKVICILSCLWMFSLLTGGSASVLRAAVMFTCIVIGENFSKKSSIYNSLAASAFLLLCYNPYFLWDVGFQLSYLAVLSIVIFQKPISHLIFIKNKWVKMLWELVSISIAAQILTFPVCIYYFHQFPLLFLFTNVITVPLSSLILYVEIVLVAFAWIPAAGLYVGKLTWWLVWCMNKIILWFNTLPFALWDRIAATITSTIFLYGIVICLGAWLLNKSRSAFKLSLWLLLAFLISIFYSSWQRSNQQKIIVYNVPQHQSIDIIDGNQYKFIGDSVLLQDGMLQNFHLKPSRIALQLNERVENLPSLFQLNNFYKYNNKKVLLVDKPIQFFTDSSKINIDCIIISKNPKLDIAELVSSFNCKQIIFDGSNSLWKIAKWKKECEALHLQNYAVAEKGAFIIDL